MSWSEAFTDALLPAPEASAPAPLKTTSEAAPKTTSASSPNYNLPWKQLAMTFRTPADAVKYFQRHYQYSESPDIPKLRAIQAAAKSQQDLVNTRAEGLACNRGGVCGDFASAAAKVAKDRGIPGGLIRMKEKDAEFGHQMAWWKADDGQFHVFSAEGPGGLFEQTYPHFADLYTGLTKMREQGTDVQFSGRNLEWIKEAAEKDLVAETDAEPPADVGGLVKKFFGLFETTEQ